MAQARATRPIRQEIQDFLNYCLDADKSLVTVNSYHQVLRTFAGWLEDSYPEVGSITAVNLSHLQHFRRHLRLHSAAQGREMALSTQAKYLSILRSWLRYAQREAGLPVVNREDVALPRRPDAGRRQTLADADVERLLDQPDTRKMWGLRDRAIIAVLLSTGLKVSQLCALDRRDVREDLLGSVPRLPIRLGRRTRPDIALDERAQLFLKAYLAGRRDSYSPLFIRHKPGKRLDHDDPQHRLTRQMVNRMLGKYSRQASVAQLVSPRMLGRNAR